MSGLSSDRMALLAAEETAHFWFRARHELIGDLLARFDAEGPYVDVGSGTGSMVRRLRAEGAEAFGFDPTAAGGPDAVAVGEALPLHDGAAGTVLLLDVIEHVAEPRRLLAECRRLLRPEGRLIAAVPAHPYLWSDRDERAGHHRRYRRGDLRRELVEGGFEVLFLTGFQFSLLPVLAANRLVPLGRSNASAREHALPRPLNAALGGVMRVERRLTRRVSLPTGSSYVAVARSKA